jgi:hypothetical protein
MSKWPLNGEPHKYLLSGILILSCLLLFSPALADVSNVQLTITPEDICEDNNATVSFHVTKGLTGGVSGIYITFDENFTINDPYSTSCVLITNSTGENGHPLDILVIHNPDPAYASFGFPNGTTTLKMTVPVNIRQNSVVTLNFTCDLDIDCPCDCSGYVVWANTDLEQTPVMSNTVFLKVRIESAAGPGGSISPAGTVLYNCCDTPTYHIAADPCYLIDRITVDALCDGCDCEEPYSVIWFNSTKLTEYDYTFNPLHCCYNITAYFKIKTCNVTVVAGPGGMVLSPPTTLSPGYIWSPPNQTRKFTCNEEAEFLIRPDISFSIDDVTVRGESVVEAPGWTWLGNGSATYSYLSDCEDAVLEATFRQSPVDAFLKYQLPKSQCGDIVEVQVVGMNDITPMVEFADSLYLGGNSSSFDVNGTSGTHFGTYSGGAYADDATSLSEGLVLNVLSLPVTNPETYGVSYTDTSSASRSATVTILMDGTTVWAPGVPTGVTDVSNVVALTPAWQMVTQDYLDHNPGWEGLVGMVIYVANGTYAETFEVDTPGLHLKNFPDAMPVIDASGLPTVGSGDYASAVFLSAGCTGIEGFTIVNSGANGIAVYPISEKCQNATILHWLNGDNTQVPCNFGRINIVNNTITGSEENGIRVIDAVILILGNIISGNVDDGIDAGCLFCGVECVDPEAITHSPACSEIIWNTISGNGPSGNGEWEVGEPPRFTNDPTACGLYDGWTDSGVQIRCTGQQPQEGAPALYIVHNTISENYHAGISLWEQATLGGGIVIQANKLIANGIFGLTTWAADPSLIDFRYNNIEDNTYWGVKNWDGDDLVAKDNYWGMPGGPSSGPAPIVQCIECRCHEEDQRSDALGNGDGVSHRVHYNPWLYLPAEQVFHEGTPDYQIRALGSDSLNLQKGWNTLSVPCDLYSSYNKIMEIAHIDIPSAGLDNEGLGWYLYAVEVDGEILSNFDMVLAWNTTTGLWDYISADETKMTNLHPGYGYYIKMKQPSRFPVLYNNVIGLPEVALADGWNLIGAPWGIDRTTGSSDDLQGECDGGICQIYHDSPYDQGRFAVADPDADDPEAFRPVWEALESIKEGDNGNKGVAVVISPSVPGQKAFWSSSVTTGFWDPVLNSREMLTGEGYWVYMVNQGHYAGFEITPFYYL